MFKLFFILKREKISKKKRLQGKKGKTKGKNRQKIGKDQQEKADPFNEIYLLQEEK